MMPDPDRILFFDGVCNLCTGTVEWIIRHDVRGVFRFASLQGEHGQAFLRGQTLPTSAHATFIYLRNGKVLDRSTAALQVARDLGFPWNTAYLLILVPRFLRDAVYALIARNRYRWFGRRDKCMVPTEEVRERFVG
ncbi:MAG TPA: thiol-disulfide oxidoreductase DCC family protein [Flavobacteriales bacterium]|nr:thiol-disulfide oxidoreductase DCC family protein [Flavobacteriales bacterium]HNE81316.1 thiol-disulfide oxidoreductase DCC family protein [Flavobacteriales bacterium]HNK69305.1 thiol-disulfide oxidoreductase DCC family protein [Flavobacteriales bacterium]